jgi:hypothetical protein
MVVSTYVQVINVQFLIRVRVVVCCVGALSQHRWYRNGDAVLDGSILTPFLAGLNNAGEIPTLV